MLGLGLVHLLPEFEVCVLTSTEKWNKLRDILSMWSDRIDSGGEQRDYKELLSDRIFLCGSDVSIDGAVFERIYLPIETLA